VQIDVEQRWLAQRLTNDVSLPEFIEQGFHGLFIQRSFALKLGYELISLWQLCVSVVRFAKNY